MDSNFFKIVCLLKTTKYSQDCKIKRNNISSLFNSLKPIVRSSVCSFVRLPDSPLGPKGLSALRSSYKKALTLALGAYFGVNLGLMLIVKKIYPLMALILNWKYLAKQPFKLRFKF